MARLPGRAFPGNCREELMTDRLPAGALVETEVK